MITKADCLEFCESFPIADRNNPTESELSVIDACRLHCAGISIECEHINKHKEKEPCVGCGKCSGDCH